MWTDKNRAKYNRDHLRYPSDLTDDEWAYVEPLIPPAKRGGGKRRTDMRAVMNGVMYILSTGCQWRYIPKQERPRPGGSNTSLAEPVPPTRLPPWKSSKADTPTACLAEALGS